MWQKLRATKASGRLLASSESHCHEERKMAQESWKSQPEAIEKDQMPHHTHASGDRRGSEKLGWVSQGAEGTAARRLGCAGGLGAGSRSGAG